MLKEFSAELAFVGIVLFLFLVSSDSSLFQSKVLNPDYLFSEGSVAVRQVFDNIENDRVYSLYKTLLYFLAIFFITIIAYCSVRMLEIRKKEHDHLHHEIHEYAHHHTEKEHGHHGVAVSKNANWNKVLTYLSSDSSSDWKLAIMEADTMLDHLLVDLGFKGVSLGDRLKMASQETFKGLSTAWEVHTIRNKIAHDGLAYDLSKHEANRIIALYESIFRQYGFI